MAKDRSQPLSEISFHCSQCCQTFKAEPGRVVDVPEVEHHPFEYFAFCLKCGVECGQVHWEKSLLKAWKNATGSKTEEGKAASAANLVGHPTKEEALRTRFNGMKHGLSARTATYFPAKPDGYSFCKGCTVDRVWCKAQPACTKQTELFMLHHAAFEQKNPKHLMGIYADLHASLFLLLQNLLQTIIGDGVKITTPQWFTDKDGRCIIAQYTDAEGKLRTIPDVKEHPLLKPMMELLSRVGLSLTDVGMTPRVIEIEESNMGRLANDTSNQESSNAFRQRTVDLLSEMAGKMTRAGTATNADPILIEYQKEGG